MACKHPPDHVVIKYDIDCLPYPLELSWRECLDCGTWLSLGPSNDEPDEVRIEIQLASALTAAYLESAPADREALMELMIGAYSATEWMRNKRSAAK